MNHRLRPPGELTWADRPTPFAANDANGPAEGKAIRGLILGLQLMLRAAAYIFAFVFGAVWILG